MISKISTYFAWVALIIVILLKLKDLAGFVSLETLLIRLGLWGFGAFILIKVVGKLADGAINLSRGEAANQQIGKAIDYTVETSHPDMGDTRKVLEETTESEMEQAR
ncbi:TPA: hypothetical protein DCX15_01520 [bacterium]|nr:hypothetical protein [bacterium]